MKTRVFLITAKTNLHVGNESGGEFTIIDKAIQRDPLTGLPCINSSSLKGAINEYCTAGFKMKDEKRKELFGSDKKNKGNSQESQKGQVIFFDAKLLYLPQQDDNTLFHYVTSEEIINMMNERIQLFEPSFKYEKRTTYNGRNVEDTNKISSLCDNDNLPIIARNALEKGESKNLWYEQVLPAETVLYTIIQEEGDDLLQALDGKIIQIGANATIGYGYCKFELINK